MVVWGAARKVRGTLRQHGGCNAHENCVFCSCSPETYKPPQQAFSSYISRTYTAQKVNIRLTHPKKSAAEHRVIIALGVIGQEAPATLDVGSDPVGRRTLSAPLWLHRGLAMGHRSEFGSSDEVNQALGGVGRFRFLPLLVETSEGGHRHRHRASELFPALWRHLPGQEHAEVRRACAAMLRTGV